MPHPLSGEFLLNIHLVITTMLANNYWLIIHLEIADIHQGSRTQHSPQIWQHFIYYESQGLLMANKATMINESTMNDVPNQVVTEPKAILKWIGSRSSGSVLLCNEAIMTNKAMMTKWVNNEWCSKSSGDSFWKWCARNRCCRTCKCSCRQQTWLSERADFATKQESCVICDRSCWVAGICSLLSINWR